MSNTFQIEPSIYPFYINVCVGSVDEATHFFKTCEEEMHHEAIEDFFDGDYSAYTVRLLNGDVCIHFMETDEDLIPKVVHEAFHAVEFVFDRIGLAHSRASSEAYAYYLQYVFAEIYNKIK